MAALAAALPTHGHPRPSVPVLGGALSSSLPGDEVHSGYHGNPAPAFRMGIRSEFRGGAEPVCVGLVVDKWAESVDNGG